MHTYAPFRSSPSLASVTTREWSRSKSDFNKSIVPATVIAALLLFPGALILVIRYFVKSSDEELDAARLRAGVRASMSRDVVVLE